VNGRSRKYASAFIKAYGSHRKHSITTAKDDFRPGRLRSWTGVGIDGV